MGNAFTLSALKECRFAGRVQLLGRCEATFLDSFRKIGVDFSLTMLPVLLKPIEHGVDIVVHALTKYMGGHGTSLGGMIVDSGQFPWAAHKDRYPMFNEPEASYHGVVYVDALGPAAYIGRARTVPLGEELAAIRHRCASLPVLDDRTVDQILGYDDHGLPA